jgi:hypothetical protein
MSNDLYTGDATPVSKRKKDGPGEIRQLSWPRFMCSLLFRFSLFLWRDLPAISAILESFVNIQVSRRKEFPHIALIDIEGVAKRYKRHGKKRLTPIKNALIIGSIPLHTKFLKVSGYTKYKQHLDLPSHLNNWSYSYNQPYQYSYCCSGLRRELVSYFIRRASARWVVSRRFNFKVTRAKECTDLASDKYYVTTAGILCL